MYGHPETKSDKVEQALGDSTQNLAPSVRLQCMVGRWKLWT